MHALHLPDKGKHGKGLGGYASQLAKSNGYITQMAQAAEVFTQVKTSDTPSLLDKAKHLAAIHKLPQESWSIAVDAMLKHAWSAKDPGEVVEKIPQPAQPKSRDEAGKAAGVNLTNAHRAWSIKFAALN